MTDLLSFFRDDYDNTSGTFTTVTTVVVLLDILVRTGLLSIKLPEDEFLIEISAWVELFIVMAPFVIMVICYILNGILVLGEYSSNFLYLSIIRMVIPILFIYALYSFLSAIGIVIVGEPLNRNFIHIIYGVLRVIHYAFIIITDAGDYYLRLIYNAPHRPLYNTYHFQFDSPITKEQKAIIEKALERPFNDKERHFDNIYLREKKAQEKLMRDRYIEFKEKEFSIGIEESECSVDYLDGYAHSVYMYLNRQGFQFRLTASKEKYVLRNYFEDWVTSSKGKMIHIIN